MSADADRRAAGLRAVRDSIATGPGVADAIWSVPGENGSDGSVTVTFADGTRVRADLTAIGRKS